MTGHGIKVTLCTHGQQTISSLNESVGIMVEGSARGESGLCRLIDIDQDNDTSYLFRLHATGSGLRETLPTHFRSRRNYRVYLPSRGRHYFSLSCPRSATVVAEAAAERTAIRETLPTISDQT